MKKLFGTDGIRGIANKELTCSLAMKVGTAIGKLLGVNSKILIGKDTRISSDMIESALCAGICSVGSNAVILGVLPTPAVAYLVKEYNADAGIMISASHNSFEFNGIKIFNKNGYKLSDSLEEEIESMILEEKFDFPKNYENIGKITYLENGVQKYIKYLTESVSLPKNGIKILVDCSNGASFLTAKELFSALKLSADFIFNDPNGININEKCGSTHIENLSKEVIKKGYDLAVAFDGDADRCLFLDEQGDMIDGDAIIGVCGLHMKKYNKLSKNTIVGTIMSNIGLKKFCEDNDIAFKETKVGDRYVLEEMLKNNYSIGGEQSGHVIFKDSSTTGDGELTAIKFIEVMLCTNKKASQLNRLIKKYPQKSTAIDIDRNQKGLLLKNKEISNYLDKIKSEVSENGKIVVRESGTEPKIRVMVEHESKEEVEKLLNEIKSMILSSMEGKKI